MKRKKWIILLVSVLLLLVIPIPTGHYKDGGTKEYTSLTYKVVKWNRLLTLDGTYSSTKIYPFPMNFMSIDSLWYREERNIEKTNYQEKAGDGDKTAFDAYDFSAQYIRTNGGCDEEIEYPIVKIIRSAHELNAYYEANKHIFDLERKEEVYADTTIGFLDACDKYDEAYFENQILVFVLLQEGSGSTRHEVTSVGLTSENKLIVSIDAKTPEAGTCDMAQWHIFVEPEAGVNVVSESDVTVYLDDENITGKPEVAEYSKGYANMSLNIINGWEYEIEEYEEGCATFGISFWPAGQTDGKLKLQYYTDMFGVCGTGLSQKKITIGDYQANQGIYDNKKIWNFISFIGTPGDYVVMNEGADVWWDEYGDEAKFILETITIGKDIINEEQAIEIAKQKRTVKYDEVHTEFDFITGIWTVNLYTGGTLGGDQTVLLDTSGNITDVSYGE